MDKKLVHSQHLQKPVFLLEEELDKNLVQVFDLVFSKNLHSKLVPQSLENPCTTEIIIYCVRI